jgi:tetratricopeptide (TPR) repeat protein
MKNLNKTHPIAVLAALTLAACASNQAAVKADLAPPKTEVKTAPDGTQTVVVQQPEVSNRAKLLFEDATKAFDAQKKAKSYDYASLERKFQSAIDADPQLAEAEYNLGVLAERQGQTDKAIGHYKKALSRKPTLKQAGMGGSGKSE